LIIRASKNRLLCQLFFSFGIFVGVGVLNVVHANDGRCPAAIGKDFPPAVPAEVGLSSERLLRLNQSLDAGTYEIRSLLVLRDCKLILERYKTGLNREHNHTLYSVTKSVAATLVGSLLHQGKLRSIDVPISELISKPLFFSGKDWEKTKRISLKNVMQMASGLAYHHNVAGRNPLYALETDRLAMALSSDFVAEPGTRFNYSDADVSIAGAAISGVADRNLFRFAKEVLFDVMQMSNYDWLFVDRSGRYPGGWGLRIRPMDMLKVGQLYLQKGQWNDIRVFDANFLDEVWRHGPSKSYALYWWIGSGTEANGVPYFVANGFKGQRIYVFPTLRLVAALTASLPGAEEQIVNRLIVEALVESASVTSTSGGEADTALRELQKRGFGGQTRVAQDVYQDAPR
jgi:CubicO group peptidase (beta-lactamase class C family)